MPGSGSKRSPLLLTLVTVAILLVAFIAFTQAVNALVAERATLASLTAKQRGAAADVGAIERGARNAGHSPPFVLA